MATTSDTSRSALDTIQNSVALKIAVAGGVVAAIGFALQQGVYPAIMVIWGGALLALGLFTYAVIWINKPD